MGERKGQNHYYPPDYDPKKGSLNAFLGTHALRERARKIHLGIIIIRFEMPYNIWCEGCKNHIGMGVRYNAEKTKVGMYYSTPVYQFRMKCHLCDNHFEIKTDPGNLDYVIVKGARRQENRWDPTQNEQIVPETKEVQRKLFDDPMYKLEHGAKDQQAADDAKPVIGRLYQRNNDVWKDCFEANSRLRAEFRKQKKEIKATEEKDNELLKKSSLDIKLLPESADDQKVAKLLRLHASKDVKSREKQKQLEIMAKPALPSTLLQSFGGLKRENLLKRSLTQTNIGVVKKKTKLDEPSSSKESQEKPKEDNKKGNSSLSLLGNYSSSESESDHG
ncbi:coiled-coil domain-containing protein 130 homolog [Culicoides brevitarsis]|uniref:coiled-coil domain-containing protein 130 homolog n=1 Tax=Culicoides brevitarsis TaxID=469753 RepID=UPI00307C0CA7